MNKEYPIIDEHRKHYILHPIQLENKKWVAVEVLLSGGYINPIGNPTKISFNTEKECQDACDLHNKYHGWSKKQVHEIINTSMKVNR